MEKKTNENVREIEMDRTEEEVREKERFYGLGPTIPLVYGPSVEDLYNDLIWTEEVRNVEQFPSSFVSIKKLRDSTQIWDQLGIKLWDVNLLDTSKIKVENEEIEITQDFFDAIKIISPKDIPIILTRKDKEAGMKGEIYSIYSYSSQLKRPIIFYVKIKISRCTKEITTCLYNHEITHTQFSSKESCGELLNFETIPILMEEVFAEQISEDTLIDMRNFRLYCLAVCLYHLLTLEKIPYNLKIKIDTYIKSTFQAISLMDTYLKGSSSVRKEMMTYVNQIFKEEKSVEEMLAKYEALFQDVPKEGKNLFLKRGVR